MTIHGNNVSKKKRVRESDVKEKHIYTLDGILPYQTTEVE